MKELGLNSKGRREGFGEWEYPVLICVLKDPSGCGKEHRVNIMSLEAETLVCRLLSSII